MQTIQIVMRRFVIVLSLETARTVMARIWARISAILEAIKNTVFRVRTKVSSLFIRVREVSAETTAQPDEPYADDTEDRFLAWEAARGETLQQAEDCERQALRLLARAALLRTAVKYDDRGETYIADELREHADEVPEFEAAWCRPQLRLVTGDDASTQRGA